jgi:hypothetical protein
MADSAEMLISSARHGCVPVSNSTAHSSNTIIFRNGITLYTVGDTIVFF